jgi:hypothetical protein
MPPVLTAVPDLREGIASRFRDEPRLRTRRSESSTKSGGYLCALFPSDDRRYWERIGYWLDA